MHRLCSPLLALVVFACGLCPGQALAVSAQETGKKTLYGVFRQVPDSGIVFADPQETGVVYLPFDPKGIMSSYLDIQVQVQGEIRDSFNRDGKTYRVLTVDDIHPLTAEYGATTTQSGRHVGLAGTDTADVHAYQNKTCYLYERYAVLETLADYSDGHTLRVLARAAGENPSALCEGLQGMPLFEIPNGGDFSFAGLSGNTLFVENGPTHALHGLMAVNLASRKQTLDATVLPGATVGKGILHFTEKTGALSSCPAGTLPMRKMGLDLASGKAQALGTGFCRPGEGTPF